MIVLVEISVYMLDQLWELGVPLHVWVMRLFPGKDYEFAGRESL